MNRKSIHHKLRATGSGMWVSPHAYTAQGRSKK
jgi:hypothetical protein